MNSNEKMLGLYESRKFEELKAALEENIREEIILKQTKGKRLPKSATIIKSMMKKANNYGEKFQMNHPMDYHGKHYECFLDGYRLFCDSTMNYGYKEAEGHQKFDFSKMLLDDIEMEVEVDEVRLEQYLKIDYKNQGKYDKKPFVIEIIDNEGITMLAIDPNYLKDAMNFIGTNKIGVVRGNKGYGDDKKRYIKSPIIIKDEDEDKIALVLPVYIKNTTYKVCQTVEL